jgi:hypothetical protein
MIMESTSTYAFDKKAERKSRARMPGKYSQGILALIN